jgi:pimeloyl-ACP methyl ester carboxylesterase
VKQRLLKLFGLLLMVTALAVPLARAPDRPVQTLVARWAPPPSDFIDVKGQIVHVRDEGPRADPSSSTPAIVLLHGTSASLHTWEGWVRTLKKTRRVITFDLPGFGLTGPFAGQYAAEDYRGDTYARFVLDVLDALKVNSAVIGGNSLGGEVAWRAVTLAPSRFTRLLLVDASGYAFTPGSIPLGFRIARIPMFNRLGEHLLPRALVAASVANVYADDARITEALVDRYYELTLREGNRHALGLRLQQLEPGAATERLKSISVPTLVLWGGEDQLIPVENARRFASDIAGARVVVLDGLGHVPQEEDAARSLAPVLDFLEIKP